MSKGAPRIRIGTQRYRCARMRTQREPLCSSWQIRIKIEGIQPNDVIISEFLYSR